MAETRIYGIRHHGPGSAWSLQRALTHFRPDSLLIEGPADASPMIPWLGHEDLAPPVALVIYRPENPKRASSYPFAVFSPEYQAMRYALDHAVEVRFMDLPQAYLLGIEAKLTMPGAEQLTLMTEAAGQPNYEHWWHQLIEQRQDDHQLFEAIMEMMSAVREALAEHEPVSAESADFTAEQREAHMRQAIRQAQAEGFKRLAVICGAFHAPALNLEVRTQKQDEMTLAGVSQVEVDMAWVPWTYSRLATFTGYGAGVPSPGWYQHLWDMHQQQASPTESTSIWLSQVARLLRREGFPASAAHIIESTRLAEATAALRGKSSAGLAELKEAVQAVMCFGNSEPLQLIAKELIIGERMGSVPADSPMVPIQRDLYLEQQRLELHADPEPSTLNLDVREERDLERSHLFYRLNLLAIPWAKSQHVRGKAGTYHEIWRLQWQPEFAIRVIEANIWGNTVKDACHHYALDLADKAADLATLTDLLDKLILADLSEAIAALMLKLEQRAALSSDVAHMMAALPPLARILRYGNVRETNQAMIQAVVDGLLARICVQLPATCASLSDEASLDMFERMNEVQGVVATLRDRHHQQAWQKTLDRLLQQQGVHGLIGGRACRLLVDSRAMPQNDAKALLEGRLSLNPSASTSQQELKDRAFWIEGFLRGSGLVIVHDSWLWQLIDGWVNEVEETQFLTILPLLRRTFSGFSDAAKQKIQDRVNAVERQLAAGEPDFDQAQAETVLVLLRQLLGPRL